MRPISELYFKIQSIGQPDAHGCISQSTVDFYKFRRSGERARIYAINSEIRIEANGRHTKYIDTATTRSGVDLLIRILHKYEVFVTTTYSFSVVQE